MTAEQLEELLGKVTQGEWSITGQPDKVCAEGYTRQGYAKNIANCEHRSWMGALEAASNAELTALAPSLARRVIAAEKLVEAIRPVINSHWNESHIRGMYELERALQQYEASK